MASSKAHKNSAFIDSGFFVLRTPLLAFDEFLSWNDGLKAAASLADPARLEETLAADRSRLHARLHAAMARPEVREALFVASPDLESSFDLWISKPESERSRGLEQAMARYFLRMTGRATPFGLCAGCSVGRIDNITRLVIEQRSNWRRRTRLDMDYLSALAEALASDPKLRNAFSYRPNSSLYRAAGRLRYAESKLINKERSYHLVAVEETDALNATLARARDGATFSDLTAALVDGEITLKEAEEYIANLVAEQILMPDIGLFVTGPEPTNALIEQFAQKSETARIADVLNKVRTEFCALDTAGLGNSPERYRAASRLLEELPAKVELSRLVQVEMIKPAAQLTIGRPVLAEIARGVEILHRFARPRLSSSDDLARFRDAFMTRYEQRLVPLVEALDAEIGLGFPLSTGPGADASPLLQGIDFPSAPDETARWDAREKLLLRKLSEALWQGDQEIALESADLEELSVPEPVPLPDAFAVAATIAAASEQAIAAGNFRALLMGGRGPSGAVLLGRFCHADPALLEEVQRHLHAEEALHPDAAFAEIVHLPEGRLGNILSRPVLRDYEIPYLGCSGSELDRQVPVTDLHLAVRRNRLVLFSKQLGREIIPRLTSAHNFTWKSLPLYRFLCGLQGQDSADLGWEWGVLRAAPFLPRVTSGRLVFARATWRAEKKELRALGQEHGAARFRAVQDWRAARRIPRFVVLAEGDNELPLDLENILCVDTFIDRMKGRDDATLVELFPAPESLCARGPEGRYVHEMVVPFVRTASAVKPSSRKIDIQASCKIDKKTRSFPPGSEWLYAQLYTGTATADQILREVIGPLVRQVVDSGLADQWFFIRYGDPDWHVRLRFHGMAERLHAEVLPALQTAVAPLLDAGRLWRFQIDTYEREVERYGGPEGMLLAERLFQIDSEAVLEILDQLEPGDIGFDERWRLTLRGIDALLTDLGFDLETKAAVLKKTRTEFLKEFRADANLKDQLSERFRKQRQGLEALLDATKDAESALAPGFEILRRRSAQLLPIVTELKGCEAAGRLSQPLSDMAPSYIHMHVNRLLRSAQRAHELVFYDFLARLYDSQLARGEA